MHCMLLKSCLAITMAMTLVLGAPMPGAAASAFEAPLKERRNRPLVAIIADNAGTETADVIVPYGILKEADVADVMIVAVRSGPLRLMPALTVQPDTTIADFDAAHPEGADIVIVPAQHDSSNATVIGWIRQQSQKHALIASICEGAWLSAAAGILDGKTATTHWYSWASINKRFPRAHWLHDQRYIFDRGVMTTTGVTASLPATLALVEAIAGPAKAKATAEAFGIRSWAPEYDSTPFHLTISDMMLVSRNVLAVWGHETLPVSIGNGVDEVSLALMADAWSRTYRSQVIAVGETPTVRSRHGLIVIPEPGKTPTEKDLRIRQAHAIDQLDQTLTDIATRYGRATSDFVALQLEYPRD
jgi:putative intracellular protease/amidase